jgi:superfamily II DNA helicase RecQ
MDLRSEGTNLRSAPVDRARLAPSERRLVPCDRRSVSTRAPVTKRRVRGEKSSNRFRRVDEEPRMAHVADPRIDWQAVLFKAQSVFGVSAFRPGQRELIEAVLSAQDAFGILPTGGGKSLVFQLASLFLDRPVVVVSPLVSLAGDQTDKLELRRVPALRER